MCNKMGGKRKNGLPKGGNYKGSIFPRAEGVACPHAQNFKTCRDVLQRTTSNA